MQENIKVSSLRERHHNAENENHAGNLDYVDKTP